jgi:hypothetical protein
LRAHRQAALPSRAQPHPTNSSHHPPPVQHRNWSRNVPSATGPRIAPARQHTPPRKRAARHPPATQRVRQHKLAHCQTRHRTPPHHHSLAQNACTNCCPPRPSPAVSSGTWSRCCAQLCSSDVSRVAATSAAGSCGSARQKVRGIGEERLNNHANKEPMLATQTCSSRTDPRRLGAASLDLGDLGNGLTFRELTLRHRNHLQGFTHDVCPAMLN